MLFDEIERTETRIKNERESTYYYYNMSARKPIAAVRRVLQEWFGSFPPEARKDLLSRFRSPIDSQHESAFWELYLHEVFSNMALALMPHPEVEGSPNRPDFLAMKDNEPKFFLEGIVAGLPSKEETGADARLAEVFDQINKLESPDYFLEVHYKGMPKTPPPVRKLRIRLERWLNSIDLNAITSAYMASGFDSLPMFEWTHQGITLFIRPIPKSPVLRGTPGVRPIGITMPEVHISTTDKDIQDAVEAKAKKYGQLRLPLVVAVNVLSGHCDDIDIFNALLGRESVVYTSMADGSHTKREQRIPDGVWFGKKGPRNAFVSAVLIGSGINPFNCAERTPVLISNPYPKNILTLPEYPLPECIPDHTTNRMQRKDGKKAGEYLRLPLPWPPQMD